MGTDLTFSYTVAVNTAYGPPERGGLLKLTDMMLRREGEQRCELVERRPRDIPEGHSMLRLSGATSMFSP